jgi:glycylpeptide N-tetradecanoyltransferase
VGIRSETTGKLLAFVAGTPLKTKVNDRKIKVAQINYLCVNKKLRNKRLAPILIKEVTRRVNLSEVWQAVYTAGVVIPIPAGTATYSHRSLNPKKLIEVGFSALPMGESMASHLKKNKLPVESDVQVSGVFREMQKKDISAVFKLLQAHLKKYKLQPVYTQQEVAHLLLPRNNVIYTYVVEDEAKNVTDFVSFYHLPT